MKLVKATIIKVIQHFFIVYNEPDKFIIFRKIPKLMPLAAEKKNFRINSLLAFTS